MLWGNWPDGLQLAARWGKFRLSADGERGLNTSRPGNRVLASTWGYSMADYTVCDDVLCTMQEAQEECRCSGRRWADFLRVHGHHSHYHAMTVLDWLYR